MEESKLIIRSESFVILPHMSAWKKISATASILLVIGIFLFIFLLVFLFFAILAVVGLYVAYRIYRHYRPSGLSSTSGSRSRGKSRRLNGTAASPEETSSYQKGVSTGFYSLPSNDEHGSSSPNENVRRFIESLSSRAKFGMLGEKPIAVIAALEYLCEAGLTGVEFLELLGNSRHSRVIRSKFIQLATQYGRISSPSNSWGVITGSTRELQRAAEQFSGLDASFSRLAHDQICSLAKEFSQRLGNQPSVKEPTPALLHPASLQVTNSENSKSSNLYRVLGPTTGHGFVEVWSRARLPFEPKGWLKDLRSEIRAAVGTLDCGSEQVIHAIFASSTMDLFDVENVLFYNVGTGYFARSARWGLRFERSFAEPPPMYEGAVAPNYQSYRLEPKQEGFTHWTASHRLAEWDSVSCRPISAGTRAESVWYDMKRGTIRVLGGTGQGVKRFGLALTIHAPNGSMLNLAAVVKPFFDGVVASFHQHDDAADKEVSRRLALSLGVGLNEIHAALQDRERNILGTRRLLWPWGDYVQWNPADDSCAAGSLMLEHSERWHLSGQLFEVAGSATT